MALPRQISASWPSDKARSISLNACGKRAAILALPENLNKFNEE